MTVKELRELLSKYPDGMEVCVWDENYDRDIEVSDTESMFPDAPHWYYDCDADDMPPGMKRYKSKGPYWTKSHWDEYNANQMRRRTPNKLLL